MFSYGVLLCDVNSVFSIMRYYLNLSRNRILLHIILLVILLAVMLLLLLSLPLSIILLSDYGGRYLFSKY